MRLDRKLAALLSIFAAIFFVAFFRPLAAFTSYTQIDDLCYLKWVAILLNQTVDGCVGGSYPPGSALMWLPAGIPATLFGWVSGADFVEVLPIFVGLLEFLYWSASLFLIAASIREVFPSLEYRRTGILSLAVLLATPSLYYATHRTSMIHAPEIFLACALAWLTLKSRHQLSVVTGATMALLRLNDAPALLLPLSQMHQPKIRGKLFWGALIFLLGMSAFLIYVAFVSGYHNVKAVHLMKRMNLDRLRHFLVAGDWGMLWTGNWWLWIFVSTPVFWKKLSRYGRAAWIWMGLEALICISWRGNGSDFGYRYLIGSYCACLLIWLELMRVASQKWKVVSLGTLGINAAFLTWVAWLYKEFEEVTPRPTTDLLWTRLDLLSNAIHALPTWDAWIQPWRHSAIGAFYLTLQGEGAPGSLNEPLLGLRLCVLGFGLVLALIALVWGATTLARTEGP